MENNHLIVEQEVKKIVSGILQIDESKIQPETSFTRDLGADSMMVLEIMAALDKKFHISIPEDDLPNLSNLKNSTILVNSLLSKNE